MKAIKLDIAHPPAQSLAYHAEREREKKTHFFVCSSFISFNRISSHSEAPRVYTFYMPTHCVHTLSGIYDTFSFQLPYTHTPTGDYTWVHPTGAYPAMLYVKQCYTNDQSHQAFWVMMCTQLLWCDFLNRQNEEKNEKNKANKPASRKHPEIHTLHQLNLISTSNSLNTFLHQEFICQLLFL